MITKVTSKNAEKYEQLFIKATELLQNAFSDSDDYNPEDYNIKTIYQYYGALPKIFEAIELMGMDEEQERHEKKSFTILPLDEVYFSVNADTRDIVVPNELKSIGVVGDQTAEIVYFLIDRYFDAIDFGSSSINAIIEWNRVGDKGAEGVTKAWIKELKLYPNKVYIGWPIDSRITEKAGNIEFALRLFKTNSEGDIDYSFSTKPTTVTVNKTLDLYAGENIEIDDYDSLILDRITSTDFSQVDGSNELNPPVFVVNVGNDSSIYNSYTNGTYYADLDPNKLLASVFAYSANGTNNIKYVWQRYQNGQWSEDLTTSTTKGYLKENSKIPDPNKNYVEFDGSVYLPIEDVTAEDLATDSHNIYYEVNQLEVNEIGIYRCKVVDSAGIMSKTIYSATFYVLKPEKPKVKVTEDGSKYKPLLLDDAPELTVLGGYDTNGAFYHTEYDKNNKTLLTFQWKKGKVYDVEQSTLIENESGSVYTPSEEGYYYGGAITERNKQKEYSDNYTTYRVTESPKTFELNNCDIEGLTGGLSGSLGSTIKIKLKEPANGGVSSDTLTYKWYRADNEFSSTIEEEITDFIISDNKTIELNTSGMTNGYFRVKVINTYNTFNSEEFYLPTPGENGERKAFPIS